MAVLLWVSWASVTYDLHKCEWVSRASPSVFGVILLRSKIFYCAHPCQHLPLWCGGFPFLPPLLLLNPVLSLIISLPVSRWGPRDSSLLFLGLQLTGLGKWQNGCRIIYHCDILGAFFLPELEGIWQESHHFKQRQFFVIKWNCALEGTS